MGTTMQLHTLTIIATVLSTLGMSGCSTDTAPVVAIPSETHASKPPEPYTDADHDRIYQQGCDLISPYMQIVGKEARPAGTREARQSLMQGISLLEQVVHMNPDNWSAYWVIGKAYQALQDSKKACDAFGRSFALQKNHADVAREYMLESLNVGRTAQAVDAAEHGARIRPNDAGLLANLALAYLLDGKIEDALRSIEKSIELAPDDEISKNLRTIVRDVQDGKRTQPQSIHDL